jgi:broad specificity phosphatase PhoE
MFGHEFYFLRHGETEANASGVISGALDVDLTALGREQAQAAARILSSEPITAIYSSPLRRARDTAEPVARLMELPVYVIPELTERRRGALEGKSPDAPLEGAEAQDSESFDDFTVRVLNGLSRVDCLVPLIVAHLGVFRVLCQSLDVIYAVGPIANALPLRFTPFEGARWKIEALTIVR